jgi:hypothetical protein
MDKIRHKLQTSTGKAIYRLRKQVIETVFGVIKSAIGITKFRLSASKKVRRVETYLYELKLKKCIVF